MNTLIVNLFGAPGAGKSTISAYIFALLKMRGYNCELVTEFAKDKVWEENKAALSNQLYVFGQQSFRISRVNGQVDVIITDSPLPLSLMYGNSAKLGESFAETVMADFNSYNNMNLYINRVKDYNPVGRIQTEEESDKKGFEILNLLIQKDIPFRLVNGDENGCEEILSLVEYCLKHPGTDWTEDTDIDTDK